MKIVICSLLLSCCAVSSTIAADSREMFRNRLVVCSQFVIIEDPVVVEDLDPAIVWASTRRNRVNAFNGCPLHRV